MSGRDGFDYTSPRLASSLVDRAEKNIYIPLNIDLWITSVDYEEIASYSFNDNKYNIEADQMK
jgi:hypothetical protein